MNALTGADVVAFAREELRVTLRPAQEEMARSFVDGPYHEAVWRCGRRGGKSRLADVLALVDVVLRGHLQERVMEGEPRIAGIVSPRESQSLAHVAMCREMVGRSRAISAMLRDERADRLVFSNGAELRSYPASARGIRGDGWSSAIFDEAAHFVLVDGSNAADESVYSAVVPSLAAFDDEGWLFRVSTPLWQAGQFYKRVQRAESGRFPWMHYRHYTTAQMNPAISAGWLEERRLEDPESFAREYLGEFIDGAASYLSSADVTRSVRSGIGNLPPVAGVRYRTAIDPAFNMDRFAMVVAHAERVPVPESSGDRRQTRPVRTVVDAVFAWHRKGYEEVLDEVRDVASRYGVRRVLTDQGAAEPVRAGLARRGLVADYRPWTSESKRDAMAAVKLALNTGGLELPDDAELVKELTGLEARPTPSGLTRIAAAGSGHDDRATALAAVVADLSQHTMTPEKLQQIAAVQEELRAPAARPGVRSLEGLGVLSGGRGSAWPF